MVVLPLLILKKKKNSNDLEFNEITIFVLLYALLTYINTGVRRTSYSFLMISWEVSAAQQTRNIYTMLVQHRRSWADVVYMFTHVLCLPVVALRYRK